MWIQVAKSYNLILGSNRVSMFVGFYSDHHRQKGVANNGAKGLVGVLGYLFPRIGVVIKAKIFL